MKTYYCVKCKKNHRSGKIWEDHKPFKEEENTRKNIPSEKIIFFDPYKMRGVGLRQIGQLFIKMGSSSNRDYYIQEINRLITHEKDERNQPKTRMI